MNCKNCEKPLRTDYSFCSNCGAKIIRNRITIKNLWYDFTERYFNVDNTFLRTFWHLFAKPEKVIGGYIEGVRKKYLNPIGYYAIAISLTGILFFVIKEFFIDQINTEWLNPNSGNLGKDSFETTIKYQSLISVISIPFYALLSKIIFLRNKKLNFSEHIIAHLYLFGQYTTTSFPIMLLLLTLGANYLAITYIGILFQIIYVAYVFKRIFKLTLGKIIWKTFLFTMLLVFLLIVTTIAFTLITYLIGGVEALQEMGRPSS